MQICREHLCKMCVLQIGVHLTALVSIADKVNKKLQLFVI